MILPTGRGLPDWTAGTATATQGQRNVSFAGAGLIAADPTTGEQLYAAGRGDFFMIDGLDAVPISAVIDANTIQLARPWSAATQNGVPYAIIRMSFPASGSISKAIKDIYDQGSDAKPDTTRTLDDSTARIKIDPHSGAPAIRVGAAGAADGALLTGIQFDKDTGAARFPNGVIVPSAGFRNRFINGGLDVWQRGANFSIGPSSILYTADRWVAENTNPSSTMTVSRVAAPLGFSGPNAIELSASTGQNWAIGLIQRIEGQFVSDLEGVDCVLSFDAALSTSAGTAELFVFLIGNSTLDSGTWDVPIVPGGWLIPVPSTPGHTAIKIPAATMIGAKNGLAVYIRAYQRGAAGNLDLKLGNLKFERGPVATPFDIRPLGVELALCQRYYQTGQFRVSALNSYIGGVIPTKVPMRAVASASFADFAGNASKVTAAATHNIAIGLGSAIVGVSPSDYLCDAILSANVSGTWAGFVWTLNAEL